MTAQSNAVLLGVDCGGSHTAIVIGDVRGQVLARAEGPGSAMRPGGAERSAAVILEVARRAAAQAGVSLPAAGALVGAAGAGRKPEREALEAAISAAGVAARVAVRGDVEIALASAFGKGPGILVNAGTGSIAYARVADGGGRLFRAGGHGWQLGDEGGGYWLGRRALSAAARAQDGLEESSTLLERLLVALGLQSFDDLIRWTSTATPAQVAALAPHVLNAAREGEMVAQRIVQEAAGELAQLVRALARHFSKTNDFMIATAGGLLRPGSPLLAALHAQIGADLPGARFADVSGAVDAPVGALRMAVELFGAG